MADRIDRLAQLNDWLDAGRIDRTEFETLKRELLPESAPAKSQPSEDVGDLANVITQEVRGLKESTYESLGVTKSQTALLGQDNLQAIEFFIEGIKTSTANVRIGRNGGQAASPDNELLAVAIYGRIIPTIHAMIDTMGEAGIPYESRAFMAMFSLLTWKRTVESVPGLEPPEGDGPADIISLLKIGPHTQDELLPGGFVQDDSSEAILGRAWESVPVHGFLVQKLRPRVYEWVRSTTDNDGKNVIVAKGLEKSERKAEEQRDSQIGDLAIECARARVLALTVASESGYVPPSHSPSFMWGPVSSDVFKDGRVWPLGLGIWAQYGGSHLPLVRVGHHEIARKLVLGLATVTGDESMVQDLLQEEANRQFIESFTRLRPNDFVGF